MRLQIIRQRLAEHNLDAILVTSSPNVFYLSGFTGTNGTLLITPTHHYIVTDFRYIEQAQKQAQGFEIIRADVDYIESLKGLVKGLSRIGVEDTLTWRNYDRIQDALSWCTLEDGSELIRRMRQVKDEKELDIIRKAIEITDEAIVDILQKIQIGMIEEEIALELEFALRKKGASGRSFDYIVASGERAALPHGVASHKKTARGELLTIDFGAKYQGYCSDLTRTVMLGNPGSKHQEIYDIVLEAQQAGLSALRPGVTGKDVDAAARSVITSAGYGEYFGHGLGHSLGIEIHESPRLSIREEKVIEPGMVLTVEPGIYIPGWGGVRIEDVVFVTNNGAEVLTQAPKQFIIID